MTALTMSLRLPSIPRLVIGPPLPTNYERTTFDDLLVGFYPTPIPGLIWSGWSQVRQVDSKL
jgi:hypothetical protein